MSIFTALLFFILTPGILISIPSSGPLVHKAGVHAIVFALVYHLTHKMVWNYFYGRY